MNMKREKSLADNAKHNIEICCETLCDKQVVQEYISKLEKENEQLRLEVNNLRNKLY